MYISMKIKSQYLVLDQKCTQIFENIRKYRERKKNSGITVWICVFSNIEYYGQDWSSYPQKVLKRTEKDTEKDKSVQKLKRSYI